MLPDNQTPIESDDSNHAPDQSDTDVSPTPPVDWSKVDLETEPTPEELVKFYHWQRLEQRKADNAIRDDLWIRLYSCRLVRELKNLIEDYTGEVLTKQGIRGAGFFDTDRIGEILLWMLTEYLTQSQYDRDDETYQANVRFHQLTAHHAGNWFDADVWDGQEIRASERGRNDLDTPTASIGI